MTNGHCGNEEGRERGDVAVTLQLTIPAADGEARNYELRSLDPRKIPGKATVAWVLLGPRTAYRIIQYADGSVACDCSDAGYRKHLCKHIHALRAEGLIETFAQTPESEPTLAQS